MRRVGLVLGLLWPLWAFAAEAPEGATIPPPQRGTAEALRDRALKGTRAALLATELCDEAGARMPGTEGDRRAVAWGLRVAKQLSLSNVRSEPVPISIWLRGEETGQVVSPTSQPLAPRATVNSPLRVETSTLSFIPQPPDSAWKMWIVLASVTGSASRTRSRTRCPSTNTTMCLRSAD